MFGKSKVIEELKQLHDFAYDCECALELVNSETHESIKPDPAAIKAGFIAGIVAACAIVTGDLRAVGGLKSQMFVGMKIASKVYLEETLARGEESGVVQHG